MIKFSSLNKTSSKKLSLKCQACDDFAFSSKRWRTVFASTFNQTTNEEAKDDCKRKNENRTKWKKKLPHLQAESKKRIDVPKKD
jgi:hypothetical protein